MVDEPGGLASISGRFGRAGGKRLLRLPGGVFELLLGLYDGRRRVKFVVAGRTTWQSTQDAPVTNEE